MVRLPSTPAACASGVLFLAVNGGNLKSDPKSGFLNYRKRSHGHILSCMLRAPEEQPADAVSECTDH